MYYSICYWKKKICKWTHTNPTFFKRSHLYFLSFHLFAICFLTSSLSKRTLHLLKSANLVQNSRFETPLRHAASFCREDCGTAKLDRVRVFIFSVGVCLILHCKKLIENRSEKPKRRVCLIDHLLTGGCRSRAFPGGSQHQQWCKAGAGWEQGGLMSRHEGYLKFRYQWSSEMNTQSCFCLC